MSASLSYWVTILNDNGTVLHEFPVNGWVEGAGIKIDGSATELQYLNLLERNKGKQLRWVKAWEEITPAPLGLLLDVLA